MTETIPCDNCGAPLAAQDEFCGECGAPRPTLTQGVVPVGGEAPPASVEYEVLPPAAPPSASRRSSGGARTAAKIIAILAAVAAVGLCGLGLIVALVTPVEEASRTEMLAGSTILCLCPGTLALILAIVLWAVVIRRR
jgi:hypothetical protein